MGRCLIAKKRSFLVQNVTSLYTHAAKVNDSSTNTEQGTSTVDGIVLLLGISKSGSTVATEAANMGLEVTSGTAQILKYLTGQSPIASTDGSRAVSFCLSMLEVSKNAVITFTCKVKAGNPSKGLGVLQLT